MHLTLNEIKKGYAVLKRRAFESFDAGDYDLTLSHIDQAVGYVQQFNWIYKDDDLETLLSKISHLKISSPAAYIPKDGRVVLFDDWCTSYVLALQYVEALSLNFKEVLYITGRDVENMGYKNILDSIAKYANVKPVIIPQKLNRYERSQFIVDTIADFCPVKLFLHIGYNSPIILALYSLPSNIDKYLINLADQTFWLGVKAIDYTLEFRPFGASVSLEKRGLKKEQLLYLPFYPVRDGNPFQGFPKQAEGKVIIFSGGDFYKTLDPEFTYWNLVRDILNENKDVVFLYAIKNMMGKTKDFIDSFIKKNNFEERFIYIGFRPDIDEVVKHCDIFMGTCPVCGSLTSQLAAVNSKPILQYYLPDTFDDETEQAICHNLDLKISFTEKKAFMDEAKRLIQDKDYRKQRGQLINQAMFTRAQFNAKLFEVVSRNISTSPIKSIDYYVVAERWWWCEKLGFYNTLQQLFAFLGKRTYLNMFPVIAFDYYKNRIVSKIVRTIKKIFHEN